ncbi:Herpes-BLLF1 multi-domain protein [Pyrenophora tritici-repentis]|nr:Herpes-BLLF1 multi-domain protein [Pyrenophora tritici-repentis]
MDSRRGLVAAAVVTTGADTGADTGDGGASGTTGEFSGNSGDVVIGVSSGLNSGLRSGLGSLGVALLAFGVLGPAGASGTCTVVSFVAGFAVSGSGTGVFTTGDNAADAGGSRGVETAEVGVGMGEETAFNARAIGFGRARLGSGGLVALSCVATDASLIPSAAPSRLGGGEVSRFRF